MSLDQQSLNEDIQPLDRQPTPMCLSRKPYMLPNRYLFSSWIFLIMQVAMLMVMLLWHILEKDRICFIVSV